MPIARITCDGSSDPEVQADPLDAAMPSLFNMRRIDSPSMYSKAMLAVLGRRLLGSPVTKAFGAKPNDIQELIGEMGTALVIRALGFEGVSLSIHDNQGPDQIAQQSSSGVWGIFEAKGGEESQVGRHKGIWNANERKVDLVLDQSGD